METTKVSAAFVKAQKDFSPALKTSLNPHFKSKYVGLDGCVEAVIDALGANGIALMQKSHECDSGVAIETLFIHESGEVLSGGIMRIPAIKQDAQGYGSALTYCRRYSLMAACGIAPEDDDGNAASKQKTPAPIIPASPKTDTLGLTDSELSHITDMAQALKDMVSDGNAEGALNIVLDAKLEEPQRLALNNMLDSKTRSALKAENEARKAKK
jgi:hypothetical protein